jgi:hypothetical protein
MGVMVGPGSDCVLVRGGLVEDDVNVRVAGVDDGFDETGRSDSNGGSPY